MSSRVTKTNEVLDEKFVNNVCSVYVYGKSFDRDIDLDSIVTA